MDVNHITFFRTPPASSVDLVLASHREYRNLATSFLDLSQVYGSSEAKLRLLRSYREGKMLVSEGSLLPLNRIIRTHTDRGYVDVDFEGSQVNESFIAGDRRSNEVVPLTAMHTLFVREHNRLAFMIQRSGLARSDEEIFKVVYVVLF